MKPKAKSVTAAALAMAGALSLTACANAAPDAEKGARSQLAQFEDQLESAMAENTSPKSLWEALAPDSGQEFALLDTSFETQTGGPYAFHHTADDDELLLDVYVSVLRSSGGGIFTSDAQRYICATYVISPGERTFTRSDIECPEDALPADDGLTDREEIDP
jgi:hypothetical protein